ncbi:MAG TPA: ABC transporter substrate-binding protein [Actinomycetota bacterium]|nr:ABC transporter substrate-binding protein [Actinomycetota bacterium]
MRAIRILLACTVAASAACAPARGDDEMVVGAVYPTGGSHGTGGVEEWWGAELAAEYANRGAERPVRLELVRTETADAAPGAIRSLRDRGAEVVIGSYGSTISRTAAATASKLGLVYWETGAVGELSMQSALGERVFRVPAAGGVLGRNAVTYVDEQLGLPEPLRWAVAYVDDVYGRSVGLGAIEQAEASGHEVAARLPYSPTDDMGEVAQRVADSGANALAVAAYLEDGVALRQALLARQVPLLVSIGTSSSFCMIEFGKRLGDDAIGLLASDKPNGDAMAPVDLSPDARAALEWARTRYREKHGAGMTAPALAGFAGAWALFSHVLPAAEDGSAGSVAAAAVRTKLPPGGLPNGSGLDLVPPGEADAGSNRAATSVIWKWVAREQRAVVWPPSYAAPGAA